MSLKGRRSVYLVGPCRPFRPNRIEVKEVRTGKETGSGPFVGSVTGPLLRVEPTLPTSWTTRKCVKRIYIRRDYPSESGKMSPPLSPSVCLSVNKFHCIDHS